jgi:hypothetical protein
MSVRLIRTSKRMLERLGFAVLLSVLGPTGALAQTFADFLPLSPAEVASFQLKITWVGDQYGTVPSLVLHAAGENPLPAQYTQFQRPGINYSNDTDASFQTVNVTSAEISSIVSQLETVAPFNAGGAAQDTKLSVTVLVRIPTTRAFESILDRDGMRLFFDALRSVLDANSKAARPVDKLACGYSAFPPDPQSEITSSVTIRMSGLRREAASADRFVGSITVKNTSAAQLAGPGTLVLYGLPETVEVLNSPGTTCRIGFGGKPYLSFSPAGINPGEEVVLPIELYNKYKTPIGECRCENAPTTWCDATSATDVCGAGNQCICTPTFKVFAGPGSR